MYIILFTIPTLLHYTHTSKMYNLILASVDLSGTKDSSVEGINELYDAFIEEPVSNGRVRLDCFVASRAGVSIVRRTSSGHWRSAAL